MKEYELQSNFAFLGKYTQLIRIRFENINLSHQVLSNLLGSDEDECEPKYMYIFDSIVQNGFNI